MGGDNYVIDENGAWGNPSDALAWYRTELKRMRDGYAQILSSSESDAKRIAACVMQPDNKSTKGMCQVIYCNG